MIKISLDPECREGIQEFQRYIDYKLKTKVFEYDDTKKISLANFGELEKEFESCMK